MFSRESHVESVTVLSEVNTLYKLSVHLPSLDIYPDFPLKNPDTRSQMQTNKVVFVTAFQKMRDAGDPDKPMKSWEQTQTSLHKG